MAVLTSHPPITCGLCAPILKFLSSTVDMVTPLVSPDAASKLARRGDAWKCLARGCEMTKVPDMSTVV